MKKEVSDKYVVLLLVLAIIFSIGGAFLIYDHMEDYKLNSGSLENPRSVGVVSLVVADEDTSGGKINETVQ